MNRQIKFRVWGPKSRHMIEWQDIREELHYYIGHHSYKLMQSTGLKDRTGREIYEGDIVTVGRGITDRLDHTDVIFENGAFRLRIDSFFEHPAIGEYYETVGYEVIGNVFEDPKLLALV